MKDQTNQKPAPFTKDELLQLQRLLTKPYWFHDDANEFHGLSSAHDHDRVVKNI